MSKTIFIATAEPYCGKSIVALGLVNMLLGKATKVGYFKPIINADPKEQKDVHIETIISYFNLPIPYEESYAFTRQQAIHQVETESQGEMIDVIIRKVKKMEDTFDFTVIEGSDFVGEGTAFEFEANVTIARNLSAPAIIVVSGEKKMTAQVFNSVLTIFRTFQAREVQVLSIVANRVKPAEKEDL